MVSTAQTGRPWPATRSTTWLRAPEATRNLECGCQLPGCGEMRLFARRQGRGIGWGWEVRATPLLGEPSQRRGREGRRAKSLLFMTPAVILGGMPLKRCRRNS